MRYRKVYIEIVAFLQIYASEIMLFYWNTSLTWNKEILSLASCLEVGYNICTQFNNFIAII